MALPHPKVPNYSTPTGTAETEFRYEIRTALCMDCFARDDQMVAEIERLKQIETERMSRRRWPV